MSLNTRLDIDIGDIAIIVEKHDASGLFYECKKRGSDGFVYFIKGNGAFYKNGISSALPVSSGAMFWLRCGDAYRFSVDGDCRYVVSAYQITRDEMNALSSLPDIVHLTDKQKLHIERLAREWESRTPASYMKCKIGILSLYTELFTEENGPYEKIVRTAIDFIRSNFRRPFTGEELSDACSISLSHLRQRFRAATGMSVTEYRDSLRIEAAREMLTSGLFSPMETAYALGYSDVYHFSKVFASKTGITPARYARENQK
jgi:AraC-like DNA-binding protein